jgi:Fic family protein
MPRYETCRWEPDPDAYGSRAARRRFTFEAFIPDQIAKLDPSLPATVMARVSEAERAIQSLNQPAFDHQLGALAARLLRAESVASSWIEGLVISQRKLARVEAEGEAADSTARAVMGNIIIMERLIGLADSGRELGLDDLLSTHKALMELASNPYGAGELRTKQNWIGGRGYSPEDADHVPPPPTHVPKLVADLLDFVNRDDLPPVLQAAVAHAQFEAIHPFADGNGRVGRGLIHYILRRRGLAPRFVPPISLVLAANKDRYIQGLGRYVEGRLADWLDTFGWAIHKASRQSERLADKVRQLQDRWRERAGHPRADSAAEAIIRALPGTPVLTSAMAAKLVSRSQAAVNVAFAELERSGVLKSVSSGKWRRAMEATELLALVNEFERDLAIPEGQARPARPSPTRGGR